MGSNSLSMNDIDECTPRGISRRRSGEGLKTPFEQMTDPSLADNEETFHNTTTTKLTMTNLSSTNKSSVVWPCLTVFFFVLTILSNVPPSALLVQSDQIARGPSGSSIVTTSTMTQCGGSNNNSGSLRGFSSSLSPSLPNAFTTPPKVVLLPGPHKTGSTTTQNFFFTHTGADDYGHAILDNWVWPTPTDEQLTALNVRSPGRFKNYAPLYGVLSNQPSFTLNATASPPVNRQQLINTYKTKIHTAWSSQSNVVFGSEEMDWMASERPFSESMLDTTLQMLPFEDSHRPLHQSDIEAVILHRSPRVSHLRSIWKQVSVGTDTTFQTFLQTKVGQQVFFIVDSLALALKFLDRGIHTTIVDIQGVQDTQHDVSHVIACQVLGVDCTDDGRVKSLVVEQEKVAPSRKDEEDIAKMNSREDPAGGLGNLNEVDLANLDAVIQEYDCGLRSALKAHEDCGQVRFLFPSAELFRGCQTNAPRRSLSWLIESIQAVASKKSSAGIAEQAENVP